MNEEKNMCINLNEKINKLLMEEFKTDELNIDQITIIYRVLVSLICALCEAVYDKTTAYELANVIENYMLEALDKVKEKNES